VKYYEQYKAFRIKPEIDGNLSRVDQDIKESEMLAGEELEKVNFLIK
jgi:hypothetical protein